MIRSSTEKDFPTKQEGGINDGKNPKGPCSSRPWSGFKDPRVVRVSRSFGGKDRHSKVCTIRGLRDRRVRLSVSTAIQLYDLQDRLGLTQPSKVVDWLLNAAQDDIDKLPPLQMLPEHFIQYPQPLAVPQAVVAPQQAPSISLLGANTDLARSAGATLVSTKGNAKSGSNAFVEDPTTFPKSTNCNADAHFRAKCEEVRREMGSGKSNEIMPVLTSFARPGHSLLSNAMPYTSYYQWDLAANASVPHLAGLGFSSQVEEIHNRNSASIQSSDSLPSGSQLLLCPSGTAPSIFSSFVGTPMDGDPKQINHFQMLSSNSQNPLANPITTSLFSINPTMRPFPLNLTSMCHHSPNNHERQSNPLHKASSIATSNVGTANSFQKDSKSTTLGSNPPPFL